MEISFTNARVFRKRTVPRVVDRKRRIRNDVIATPVDAAISRLRKRLEAYYSNKRSIDNVVAEARDLPQLRHMNMDLLASVINYMEIYNVKPNRPEHITVNEFFKLYQNDDLIYILAVNRLIENLKVKEEENTEELVLRLSADYYRYMTLYYQHLKPSDQE